MTITLDTPVTDFPGVGPARAKKLEKLGILRAADLLTYYPRDYEDPAPDLVHSGCAAGGEGLRLRPCGGAPLSSPTSARGWSW